MLLLRSLLTANELCRPQRGRYDRFFAYTGQDSRIYLLLQPETARDAFELNHHIWINRRF